MEVTEKRVVVDLHDLSLMTLVFNDNLSEDHIYTVMRNRIRGFGI